MKRTALSGIWVIVATLWSLSGGAAVAKPVQYEQRTEFSQALHKFAKEAAAADEARYFAIVRRGLDALEAAVDQVGRRQAFRQVKFEAIDAAPADIDRDPNFQVITSLRLGIPYQAGARIVGGYAITNPNAYLEVVALTGANAICSGTMIDKRTVLTAAHCVCDLKLHTTSGDENIKRIYVGLDLKASATKEYEIDISGTRFLSAHLGAADPCAIRQNLASGMPDIAVVRAKTDVAARTIKIATPQVMEGSLGTVQNQLNFGMHIFGFGCTRPIYDAVNRKVKCPIEASGVKMGGLIYHSWTCNTAECAPGSREFVLKDRDGGVLTDTCAGDSGGPVIIFHQEQIRLIGVTSRSLSANGNCGIGGIYGKAATDQVVTNWLRSSGVNVDVQQ